MNRTPLNSNLNWPEDYGFWIYGSGPTYVVYVEPESIAAKSGINAGDKIIQLDQLNVSEYSSDLIKSKVRANRNSPPFVSVQSSLKQTKLVSDQNFGFGPNSFGFSYNGNLPVVVDEVEFNEAAYLSGLRKGDIILFANDIPIKDLYSLKSILDSNKTVDLKYVPVSQDRINFQMSNDTRSYYEQDTIQNFYQTVINRFFMHDKMKRDFLLNEIARYNKFGDIESLSASLNRVLVGSDERKLISLLKPLISPTHYQRLEVLTRPDQFRQIDTLRHRKKNRRSNSRKKYDEISSESNEESDEFEKSIYTNIGKYDRKALKKIISSYNRSKNFDKLYHNITKLCQSRPKSELWKHVSPLLDCEHRQCLKEKLMRKSCPKIEMSRCCSPPKRRPKVYFIESCEPVYCEPKVFKSKIYSSAPSLDSCEKDKYTILMDQLKCHLNTQECVCVKKALCDYNRNKNYCQLLYKVNKIFNTASKRSLWSKLVCYLDEHDQDYSAFVPKSDRHINNLANCSCSRISLKNPKYFGNSVNFKEKKPRSKSLFRWEPDSDEEIDWNSENYCPKLNFAQTSVSDHEYFVYDTDTEIYESEEHNIEFELDKTSNSFSKKLNFNDSNNFPIYSKSFTNFNKVAL